MPPVHIQAELLQHDPSAKPNIESTSHTNDLAGLTVRGGNYLKATADVGAFEHILTTDLLNHLVFVQKVFMKVISSCLLNACMWYGVSLSLASVKSRLVLPFWYWLTRVVPEKGPLNGCVYVVW